MGEKCIATRRLAIEFQKCLERDLSDLEKDEIDQIESKYQSDLFTLTTGFFSLTDQEAILKEAARRLALSPSDSTLVHEWDKIVDHFHTHQHWGFLSQRQKPKPIGKTAFQRTFPWGWAAFNSLVIMKLPIMYFGLRYSNDTTQENLIYLLCAFTFGLTNLFWFGWRHWNENP